jgi:hypothetical protein
VPKKSTLDEFASLISTRLGVHNIAACKIASVWNFGRVQLPYESWVELTGNQAFMASTPYYMRTDGLLFVVKDTSEQERAMTPAEHTKYNTS